MVILADKDQLRKLSYPQTIISKLSAKVPQYLGIAFLNCLVDKCLYASLGNVVRYF